MAVSTIDPNGLNVGQLGGTRNLLINSDMRIDQRNSGASVTSSTSNLFSVDRWKLYDNVGGKYTAQQNAGSVTPPEGFYNYLGITSTSAYSVGTTENIFLMQFIEGYNTAHLGWGGANAKQIAVSFWARSSLTGSFGGSIVNGNWDMSYPFNYTINSANTWEYKNIIIDGPTSGTWATTNGAGVKLAFGLGVGSNNLGTANTWTSGSGSINLVGTSGATWYITGVQLEVGDTATDFEYESYGTTLQKCQRYYQKLGASSTYLRFSVGQVESSTRANGVTSLPVQMRTTPTLSASGNFAVFSGSSVVSTTSVTLNGSGSDSSFASFLFDVSSGLTTGYGAVLIANNDTTATIKLDAEI
jgi:hypothetical protein